MGLKEKIEEGITQFMAGNKYKPHLAIIHPGYIKELALELKNEATLNLIELSAYFGIRIITSTDIATEEIIFARYYKEIEGC